ncbi:MAG TPA: hypothetical protein DCM64_12655 [Gammaproteobacteria bacterium]|jgi:hypothetical protein|nr:hypothetical protein [Gammaproteobacteria bacterium]
MKGFLQYYPLIVPATKIRTGSQPNHNKTRRKTEDLKKHVPFLVPVQQKRVCNECRWDIGHVDVSQDWIIGIRNCLYVQIITRAYNSNGEHLS